MSSTRSTGASARRDAGVALQVADEYGVFTPVQERTAVFVLVVVGALAVGFTVFPNGLPVAAEVGLLTLVWASTATGVAVALTGEAG